MGDNKRPYSGFESIVNDLEMTELFLSKGEKFIKKGNFYKLKIGRSVVAVHKKLFQKLNAIKKNRKLVLSVISDNRHLVYIN